MVQGRLRRDDPGGESEIIHVKSFGFQRVVEAVKLGPGLSDLGLDRLHDLPMSGFGLGQFLIGKSGEVNEIGLLQDVLAEPVTDEAWASWRRAKEEGNAVLPNGARPAPQSATPLATKEDVEPAR
jgi:hypothetical protein